MKKIILFNGPPRSGKDFAAQYVANNYKRAVLDKFARVLKERAHALYGFPERDMYYYEDCKDIPSNDFYGLTPRQVYINVSETYFKPHHGNRIFGQILSDELDSYEWEVLVISDSGFLEEAQVLINKYGAENIILVRVHREDCNFEGDSRSYIYLDVCNIDIKNKGDETYLTDIKNLVDSVINSENVESVKLQEESGTDRAFFLFDEEVLTEDLGGKMWPEAKESQDKDAKAPIASSTVIENPIKVDNDTQDKDYVFEDIVEGRPSLWTRIRRLLKEYIN